MTPTATRPLDHRVEAAEHIEKAAAHTSGPDREQYHLAAANAHALLAIAGQLDAIRDQLARVVDYGVPARPPTTWGQG